jgi:cholesterol transport system auxiliary component
MTRASLLFAAALLSGCFSQPRTPEPALYDLGIAGGEAPVASKAGAQPADIRVQAIAPSWLDDTAMYYRLLYEDALRTQTYAYARWVAPPAELIEQRLRQRLAEGGAARNIGSPTTVIQVELEQFVQVFETPAASFGLVSVNVRLSGTVNEEGTFSEQVAAPTPDAAGGVRALAEATDKLVARIVDWAMGARGKSAAAPTLPAGAA